MTKEEIDKITKTILKELEKINKDGFYSVLKILEENADYFMIIGERSNGKTTIVLALIILVFIFSGYKYQGGIIRRWEEDFKGKNGNQMFEGIIALGWIEKWTNGKYNTVVYYGKRWFLAKYNENGEKLAQCEDPFVQGFSISNEEHYKSTSYPNIKIILFDEFITRSYYLPDEFIKFQNLLSTIIRLRDDVKIFMCGNTVNQYCPYFKEMGITNIKTMKKGSIDVYTYGDSTLKVAVEFSDFKGKKKKSNKYFAFNNPKLNMIKHGTWEIDIYPHLPYKYEKNDILYMYFINFEKEILQCEIIYSKENDCTFTFVHRKTTPIKDEGKYLVYQQDFDPRPNYRRRMTKVTSPIEKKITDFFVKEKVFYQDNDVGEIMRNYLMWSQKESMI